MNSEEELAGLYYWVEPMCDTVPPPPCPVCSDEMRLVPPEELWYSCEKCWSIDFSWEPVAREDV